MHATFRQILGLMLTVPRAIKRSIQAPLPTDEDTLYAFYDLQVAPISYDASWFVATAERQRRRKGLKKIHFVIVPGLKHGLKEERKAYESAVDQSARLWRLHNIVVPIFTLIPSFGGLSLLPSRKAASELRAVTGESIYPAHYEPSLPVAHWPSELLTEPCKPGEEIGSLRSSKQGLRYVERWLASRIAGRHLVTITIRDYNYMPARNSNLEAWATFVRRLDKTKYLPVFVLDTERTLDPLPQLLGGFEVFREASWNVGLRMALYESSYLNLGVNNGPMIMGLFNTNVKILIFKILTPSVPQTSEEFMRRLGFKIQQQLPFATTYQRLVWEEDHLDVIEREFQKFEKLE